jgi:hypothetical protein
VDPKYLLQVSRELAGLLSDMVTKTRDELVKDEVRREKGKSINTIFKLNFIQDNLTDRAKAALDLDRLLTDLDNSAKPTSPSQSQSVCLHKFFFFP